MNTFVSHAGHMVHYTIDGHQGEAFGWAKAYCTGRKVSSWPNSRNREVECEPCKVKYAKNN